MLNKILIVFICLFFALQTSLIAGALDRYQAPSSRSTQAEQRSPVSESVYDEFRNKIRNYTEEQKRSLKKYYSQKLNEALQEKNYEAASYYGRLIDILNSP